MTLAKSYEPYGTVLTSTGTASSIFAYAGEQVDTTGLIYLRARYLNPRLGIFLARDPWSGDEMRPGSMNGFGYVEGNPINRIDPKGLCGYLPQAGPSDCERFVAEVQLLITLAQERGLNDGLIVMLLADYYTNIRAVSADGVLLPFNPTDQILGNPPGTFWQRPGALIDRWPRNQPPDDNRAKLLDDYTPDGAGGAARADYGFKRIFYDNTHHYFQVFYHSWFYSGLSATIVNQLRDVNCKTVRNNGKRQQAI